MNNSKIIYYLRHLSTVELTRFEKFVQSPYFHVHTETTRLFEDLKKYHPEFPEDQIQKEAVYKRLYPGQPYDDRKLYTLKKYLLQLFFSFQTNEELKNATDLNHALLLKGIHRKKMDKYFPRMFQRRIDDMGKQPYQDADFFLHKYALEQIGFDFAIEQDNRALHIGLQSMTNSLDHFYLIQKLKLACAKINRHRILGVTYAYPLLPELLSHAAEKLHPEAPLIDVYYRIYMMISSEYGDPWYKALREMVPKQAERISVDDLLNIYVFLINFANLRYKKGDGAYLSEMFNLYKQALAFDLLFEGATISSIQYKNIVSLGLRLEEYTWTEEFIRAYKDKIDANYREGVYHLNMANLYFSKKEYEPAMRNLQSVEFIDPFFRMSYQQLLLKSYYECDEIEPLFSLCNTFKTYIRRNKSLSDSHKSAYLNMAAFTQKLGQLKFGDRKKLPGLVKEINNCEDLVERKWLEEKVEEIIKVKQI